MRHPVRTALLLALAVEIVNSFLCIRFLVGLPDHASWLVQAAFAEWLPLHLLGLYLTSGMALSLSTYVILMSVSGYVTTALLFVVVCGAMRRMRARNNATQKGGKEAAQRCSMMPGHEKVIQASRAA